MTLQELIDHGVKYVRRLEWPFPNDHVELDVRADGSVGPIGLVRSLAAPEALGMPTNQEVDMSQFLLTDGWEPWEPKS